MMTIAIINTILLGMILIANIANIIIVNMIIKKDTYSIIGDYKYPQNNKQQTEQENKCIDCVSYGIIERIVPSYTEKALKEKIDYCNFFGKPIAKNGTDSYCRKRNNNYSLFEKRDK